MKSYKELKEQIKNKKDTYAKKRKKSGNVEVMPTINDGQKGIVTTTTNNEEVLHEKSVSKSQQRFFGMVRATQKGETKAPSSEVARVASSIKKSDAKDFAKTKHKGLPDKKVTKEEHSSNHCGKGEYFCNDRKKCMPIPKGMKVRSDGFLTKESFESGVMKARRHHRVGKLMSFKDFVKIMGEILGEWEK